MAVIPFKSWGNTSTCALWSQVHNWESSGILATAGYFWDVDGTTAYTLKPRHELFARGGAIPLGRAAGMDADPATLIDVALDAAIRFDMQIRGKWIGKL